MKAAVFSPLGPTPQPSTPSSAFPTLEESQRRDQHTGGGAPGKTKPDFWRAISEVRADARVCLPVCVCVCVCVRERERERDGMLR